SIPAFRGCMVIKPWGWAIWEHIQARLDAMIEATGHRNCYFPIFMPIELSCERGGGSGGNADHARRLPEACRGRHAHPGHLGQEDAGRALPGAVTTHAIEFRPTSFLKHIGPPSPMARHRRDAGRK